MSVLHRRVSLDGSDWLLKSFLGEDWLWTNAYMPSARSRRGWHAATVPGSVYDDLWQAGEIPNPYVERNSLLLEWIPARTWLYKKNFTVAETPAGSRMHLHFDGVDYDARFYLNGEQMSRHAGMFTPVEFDVTGKLTPGAQNQVCVVVEPAPHEQPQVGRTSLVHTGKSRMCYGWDFCPRMISIGLWDKVWLDVTGPQRIEDVWVRAVPRVDGSTADVSLTTSVSAARSSTVQIEATVRHGDAIVGRCSSRHDLTPGIVPLTMSFCLDNPRLWQPNGQGDQPLYEADVRILDLENGADIESDRRTVRFGVRSVALAANDTPDASAQPYTFVVNGRKTYINGWNWVPLDVMYGVERPAKLRRLLTLAKRANVNLLRVWGGGLIEKDAFYDLCDELGIMVWQEFIQSSSGIDNAPSDDPIFIDMMAGEARQIIPRRRNHPSLVAWCGGNELQAGPEQPLDDSAPVLAALRQVVADLDPERLWFPTTPSGRFFSNSIENIAADPLGLHDVHGPWEHQGLTQQYTLYNQGTSLFHSEFGAEGMANLRNLSRFVGTEHQWPVTRDNPVLLHLGPWWINDAMLREVYGEIGDLATLCRASQLLQAEGLRYALESNRRRQYRNSGSIPWQLNEPYPTSFCTSAVDYFGEPKPAYYAVARAYEPLHVSAAFPCQAWQGRDRFSAMIWACNAHRGDYAQCTLHVSLVGASGRRYLDRVEVVALAANGATLLAEVELPLSGLQEDIFFLDLDLLSADLRALSHNRYLFSRTGNLAPLLGLPATSLDVAIEGDEEQRRVTISNTGQHAALLVWLQDARSDASGDLYAGDNHFSLLPGERRTVSVHWATPSRAERRLHVSAWNAQAIEA